MKHNNQNRMVKFLPVTASLGGDGASLELPNSWRDLFREWTTVLRTPDQRYVVVTIMVAHRGVWRKRRQSVIKRLKLVHETEVGPVVVVFSIRFTGPSDPQWADVVAADMGRRSR
ncbi:hypothetical protein ACYOEI_36400 [Singulisphaera rosea]